MAVLPVIIAGGKGERLWPLSTPAVPKPFVKLAAGERSLFQKAVLRSQMIAGALPPLVVCNAQHEDIVVRQVAEVGVSGLQVLVEEVGRNTGPAICAAAVLAERTGQGGVPIMVLAADHEITALERFTDGCSAAAAAAELGEVVLFAITATSPATGYGYLKLAGRDSVVRVAQFVEKPDAARAAAFFASGDYAWNSGMFCFTAHSILAAFARLQPVMLAACEASVVVTNATRTVLAAASFSKAPSISIDHAIMEKFDGLVAVRGNLGWSDLGDWAALHTNLQHGESGMAARGPVEIINSRNSLVISTGPKLVVDGLEHMIAVATDEALLITAMIAAQQVRAVSVPAHHIGVVAGAGRTVTELGWEGFKAAAVLAPNCNIATDRLLPDWQELAIGSGEGLIGTEVTRQGQSIMRRQVGQDSVIIANAGAAPLGLVLR